MLETPNGFNTSHVKVNRKWKSEDSWDEARFNTSHVKVNLKGRPAVPLYFLSFNTSHVKVNLCLCEEQFPLQLFQYIPC